MSSLETSIKRSFGITITVSQFFFNSRIPSIANFERTLPSQTKGVVTTPTVKIPFLFAIPATIGAPPVPVPPPIPAVIKTMSAPSIASSISWRFSSTASRPISGRAPAPKPEVRDLPT